MHIQNLRRHGRRSFLSSLCRSGIATGFGLTAIQAARKPGPSAGQRIHKTKPDPEALSGEDSYEKYLSSLGLRHITPREVFAAHRRSRNGVKNSLPPQELWTRLGATLLQADELRDRLGVPLTNIASAYRSPDYNRQCPGAATYSQHTENRALDLVFACSPKVAFAEARRMRDQGKFKGGLGLYRGFIHIDTRGHNATWAA
ncbi:MAG: D-Ala-D-Ala carboxypeptidase family metallohydrolase [Luteolibacter sp.]